MANKTDGIDGDSAVSEFYSGLALGEGHQMAAAHGRGVLSLLELAWPPPRDPGRLATEAGRGRGLGGFDEEACCAWWWLPVRLDTREDTKETPFADLPSSLPSSVVPTSASRP